MSDIEKSANNIQRKEFDEFIRAMGLEIEQAQVKLISAANSQMLLHYWKMGNFILYYQKQLGWGAKVIQQISKALHSIFPDKKGYSPRNLQYMCQFARLYPLEILETLLHADKELELPTVNKVLSTAKGLNEFESEQKPLIEVQSTEYKKETITQQVVAQIEQLVNHVTKYLLEMGTGFAFVARQKHFQIGNSDFYADLILYNIKLHAYVVIELKSTPFKPEYAGQLNFYINVVDDKLRGEHDNKTIGLLLCKGKDEIMAQYALSGYNQAIGVSDYQLSKAIPEDLKSALPTIEEVEEELTHLLEDKENEL